MDNVLIEKPDMSKVVAKIFDEVLSYDPGQRHEILKCVIGKLDEYYAIERKKAQEALSTKETQYEQFKQQFLKT